MDASLTDLISGLFAVASFAGGLAAIIGAGAAVIAVIFAWDHYKKLQKEVKKQGDQIDELAKIAIGVSQQNNLIEERIRLSVMPIINISYAGNKGKYFGEELNKYEIKNTGKDAFEINIKLPDTKKAVNNIMIFSVIQEGRKEAIRVPFPSDMHEFEGLNLEITYRDSFYNRYHQEAKIEKKFIQVENSPPQLIDSNEGIYKKFYSDKAEKDKS